MYRLAGTARLRLRLVRGEAGFTLVELTVAALVLTLGLLSLATVLSGSSRLTNTSERTSIAIDRAQQDLESIMNLAYVEIRMQASRPAVVSGGDSPTDASVYANSAVACDGSTVPGTYRWDPANAATVENLVPCNGSASDARIAPQRWNDPSKNIGGWLYPFVTFVKADPRCDASCYAQCPTKPGNCLKRVVVAATVDGTNPPQRPVYVSGFARDAGAQSQNPLDPSNAGTVTCSNGTTAVPCAY
jgi:Tfp pilus assembly protein PilV